MTESVGEDLIDREILLLAVGKMTQELDRLVGACMDEAGRPRAPDRRALMRARSLLPEQCTHTLVRAPTSRSAAPPPAPPPR
jgi:hypothetical protein